MFKKFAEAVHARYKELSKRELFIVEVGEIFDTYLKAFPQGYDPIVKERTFHDCNTCKQFIRKLGVLVALKEDGTAESVWDDLDVPHPYDIVASRLSEVVRQAPIRTVFRSKERSYGTDHNYGADKERYDHFHGLVAPKHFSADADTVRSKIEANFHVAKRGLTEIKLPDVETVLELIEGNNLYRGVDYKAGLVAFRKLLKGFNGTDTYVWANIENGAGRLRNTAIGTLLLDLAAGKDLDFAVRSFEKMVAPENYKRPTSVITKKMAEDAIKKLEELGLSQAIHRRFARKSDVSVKNVLFVDRSVVGKMKDGAGTYALLADSVKPKTVNVAKAIKISIDDFKEKVIPESSSMEVLVENKHLGNFVSLTVGDGPEKPFKWNNNAGWSYAGEVADSIKQRVKKAGGDTSALLRFSLAWYNFDDLDIHMIKPDGHHIYFGNKGYNPQILDVDMNAGQGTRRDAVENLAINKLQDGIYKVWVHQYNKRENVDFGFTLEMEYAGALNQWHYKSAVNGNVECLEVTVKKGTVVNIGVASHLTGGSVSTEKWGVKTESLVPVEMVLNSPNYWDDQSVGNKHWLFMLKGCKSDEPTRGIYNEFLRPEFEQHRKVFEVLGSKTKCPDSDEQLSGVGFSSARGDTVTVVVDGRRSYNVTF